MGLMTPLAVRIGKVSWLPRALPQIVAVDKALQRATRGKVSVLDLAGLPNLTLTVPGRTTGLPRTTPLLCVPDGDAWLVAGSYFGGPDMPQWVGNLRAAEFAEVSVGGRRWRVRPDELGAVDRAAAWQVMLQTWPNFAVYEERTDRVIPVFRLTPA